MDALKLLEEEGEMWSAARKAFDASEPGVRMEERKRQGTGPGA
jgi:hypothetical protein